MWVILANKKDLVAIVLLTLLAPLFFYKLGQSSLVSWDEAWYAEVAVNMVKTGEVLKLVYNGSPFLDKPPGGIWLTAGLFKLFGVSNLTARLSQAVAGMVCVYVTFLLGSKMFGRLVGFASGLSLVSASWFLYRARSGNLDVLLTLSFVLTMYLAIKACESRKYFWPFCLSLAYLAMVKGIVFVPALVPSIVLIFWGSKMYKMKDFIICGLVTLGLFGVWIMPEMMRNFGSGLYHFTHSIRDSSVGNDMSVSFTLFKDYLHNGIGEWFWPGVLGVILAVVLRQRKLVVLAIFIVLFSAQFLFSPGVQIWHLIPLYPFMIILFYGSVYVLLGRKKIVGALLLTFALYVSATQLRAFWYQSLDIPAYISDEEILAKEAGKWPGEIVLDGDFNPAGAFYAGRPVTKLANSDLKYLFKTNKNFLLITNVWRLKQEGIDASEYQLIKSDRDKVLVSVVK